MEIYLTTYNRRSYINIYIGVCLSGLEVEITFKSLCFNTTTMVYFPLSLDTNPVYSRAAVSQHIIATSSYFLIGDTVS